MKALSQGTFAYFVIFLACVPVAVKYFHTHGLIAWLCEVGHMVDILQREQLAQEESLSKVTSLPGYRVEWASPQSIWDHFHYPRKKPQYPLAVPSPFPQTSSYPALGSH